MASEHINEVTVRGAGVFGLACAFVCLQRGAAVRVIDPAGPGAGASGGTVGALAPHVPEAWNPKKAFQLDSLLMAEGFWAAVAAVGGVDPGYARSGRLQPLADDAAAALAGTRGAGARSLWQGRADWRVVAAGDLGLPADWLGEGAVFVHDTLTARIAPRRAVAALVAAIRARGGAVLTQGEDRGTVIHATGAAGLADLSAALGRGVGQGIKGQSALLRPARECRDLPQLFVAGLHIVPHADGTVAIGSTTERAFDDPRATDAQLDALVETARAACPALRDAPVVDRWAGLRPRARSRAPMLGAWPGRPGHVIANGGFKIGFGMAPKVAEVIADLVLGGHDAIPAGFRVEDSLPRATP
ncbi:NAD(P)/FAD-dependent oxidoreductase [Frigidibacter sp. MR17.24]|uniref:NAD(P)/FAD-dependent oxidoreductase n=1 Tax=Frigidibacter sp. MR17.24 TaxID=3127345 RepID=UPI003012B012